MSDKTELRARATVTLRRISRREHLKQLKERLDATPKWRFIKRAQIKRIYKVLATAYNPDEAPGKEKQ